MFGLGPSELIVLGVVAILILGGRLSPLVGAYTTLYGDADRTPAWRISINLLLLLCTIAAVTCALQSTFGLW